MKKILLFSFLVVSCVFGDAQMPLKIDIINVVWGKNFTECFLKISLPLQLCAGNIGSLPPGMGRYRIFTTRDDWETMQSYPSMKKLQEMIEVDWVEIGYGSSDPYPLMNACHRRAIKEAYEENRALIFLCPDCLISNQTFQTFFKNMREGKRMVATMALRTKKEIMVPLIEEILKEDNVWQNGITSRHLVKLSMPYLHPMIEALFINNKQIHAVPTQIHWKLDSENVLGYGLHLHPLYIWPETNAEYSGAIDNDFIFFACPTEEKWKLIQDSDEICVFEFSSSSWNSDILWMESHPYNVARWAKEKAYPHHWFFFNRPIYIHASDYRQEWKVIEDQASAFIQEVKAYAGR